jgi:hypothetical protein
MKWMNFSLIAGMIAAGLFVPPATKASTEIANVTGCLMPGNGAHHYSLTDANGIKYNLESGPNTYMKKHVGQKVAVTGHLKKEDSTADMKSLRVNQVKEVGGTCPQNENGQTR